MRSLLWIIVVLLISSCTCKSDYHELALETPPRLQNKGILIGIEKFAWGCLEMEKRFDNARYQTDSSGSKCSDLLEETFDECKVMIVSHILGYENGERSDIYNPFIDGDDVVPDYETGYRQMYALKERISNDLRGGGYTHLILMSMGWHNDQYESLKRYRKILANMRNADRTGAFRPYAVVLTWPSSWASNAGTAIIEKLGHLISYLNKPQDADEIGITIVNTLVHNVLLPAVKDNGDIKTVVIGHSLGARLLARSLFSKRFLRADHSQGSSIDLYIGLQPAFSAYRFIEGKGVEGAPFARHHELNTKILITTSDFDKANPVAFWSEHLGGKDAYDTVKEFPEDFNRYSVLIENGEMSGFDKATLWQFPKKVEYVVCDFVKEHNDILDDEMGLFLFEIIVNSTY